MHTIRELAEFTINEIEAKQNILTDQSRLIALNRLKTILTNQKLSDHEIINSFKEQLNYVIKQGHFGPRGPSGSTFIKKSESFITNANQILKDDQINNNNNNNDDTTNNQNTINTNKIDTGSKFTNVEYTNKLIITVPIKSKEKLNFLETVSDTANNVYSFIENELVKLGGNSRKIDRFSIDELIRNAYDSYLAKGLNVDDVFTIKVVAKKINNKIILKIKDNANGFLQQPKSIYFKVSDITSYQNKSQDEGYFGGKRKGLAFFNTKISRMNGDLELKNRKNGGASIKITFKK